MVIINIVHYENQRIETMEITHTEWVEKAPNSILKIFIKKPDGTWKSIEGWNAYVLKQINGTYYFGGISNTVLHDMNGNKLDVPIESIVIQRPELKLGIAVPDDVWNEVKTRQFV